MADSHHIVFVLLQALAWVVFILSTVLFYLSFGYATESGIFLHNMTSMRQTYPLEVCPSGWSVYVWIIIHVWLFLWLLYGVSNICRKSDGGHLYVYPPLISPMVYFAFAMNQICFIATIILVDRRYIGYSLIFKALGIFCLYLCVYLLQRRIYQRGGVFEKENKMADVWAVRILAENGVAFFAAWLSLMFLYQLGLLIVYFSAYAIGPGIASIIILVLVAGEIGTWFVLDNFVMEKFSRYTVTPYLSTILFMAAVVDNNWNPSSASFVLASILLGCTCLLSLIKLILMFWRHSTAHFFKQPLRDMQSSIEESSIASVNNKSMKTNQQQF